MRLKNRNRQWSIDGLRFLCILCVLFNHQEAYGLFTTSAGCIFYIYAALSSICKIAVPVYFMISGALLLGKKESLKELLINRVLKFSTILIVFSVIMYVINNGYFNITDFINQLIVCNIHLPYWFLYRYLVFLLCLPLLRSMIKNMPSSYYHYILVMYLIFYSLTETLDLCCPNFVKYNWAFNIQNWLYVYIEPLYGYYVLKILPEKTFNIKRLTILALLAFLAIGMNVFLVQYDGIHNGIFREDYNSTWLILVEIFVVYLTKYLQLHVSPSDILQNYIIILGEVSFGVYLLESIVKRCTTFILVDIQKYLPIFISCSIYILIVYLIGGIVTMIYYCIKRNILTLFK